ncbi:MULTISPECIES: hypothetical protein [Burkholderia]|uniref:hypothetical protein n=1 Tax=Burkholderia TaxID=32008 RepID=UPI00126A22CE|nr:MULTISPECIES: hypothetical protein [Burkholderia]
MKNEPGQDLSIAIVHDGRVARGRAGDTLARAARRIGQAGGFVACLQDVRARAARTSFIQYVGVCLRAHPLHPAVVSAADRVPSPEPGRPPVASCVPAASRARRAAGTHASRRPAMLRRGTRGSVPLITACNGCERDARAVRRRGPVLPAGRARDYASIEIRCRLFPVIRAGIAGNRWLPSRGKVGFATD